MTIIRNISTDFPTRCAVRFGGDSKEYAVNYKYKAKLTTEEVMREFDILLSVWAHTNICITPATIPVSEGLELRLDEMFEQVTDCDFCPSDTFKAVNDVLLDKLLKM